MSRTLTFDVSAIATSNDRLSQTAWLFTPPSPTETRGALLCLAGGTYDKHYWHLEVPGHSGYSFGEHLASLGYVVFALDHLGVGDSSDVDGPAGLELLARGDAEVADQIHKGLLAGTLDDDLPPLDIPFIGVGHSMGACLTTMVQAIANPYDAVVLLGYGVEVSNVDGAVTGEDLDASIMGNYEMLRQLAGAETGATSWVMPRAGLHDTFYASDVPEEVIRADDDHVSRLPAQANAQVISPAFVAPYAAKITVPVFLGFGASRDTSSNPHAEPANYPGSEDITVHLVKGSAHCHNLNTHRAELWDRIGAWVPTVTG